MAEAGVLALPVLLASLYGILRVGRRESWGRLEWLRMVAVAALVGLLVSVQVRLVMMGAVRDPITWLAAAVCIAGMGFLAGLYLWEVWLARPAETTPPRRWKVVRAYRLAGVAPVQDREPLGPIAAQ